MRGFRIFRSAPVLIPLLFFTVTPAMAQQRGDRKDAEHFVRQVITIWSQHDLTTLDHVFAENGIYEDAALHRVMRGRGEIESFLKENFSAVPDFKVELTRVIASRNVAACEWIMSGTQTGDFPGLPATGKSFSVRGASIVLFEKGKIEHWTDYYNLYDLLQQLGALPGPAGKEH
jgi:steroid delta-isomerase-like uncharacterized protein